MPARGFGDLVQWISHQNHPGNSLQVLIPGPYPAEILVELVWGGPCIPRGWLEKFPQWYYCAAGLENHCKLVSSGSDLLQITWKPESTRVWLPLRALRTKIRDFSIDLASVWIKCEILRECLLLTQKESNSLLVKCQKNFWFQIGSVKPFVCFVPGATLFSQVGEIF